MESELRKIVENLKKHINFQPEIGIIAAKGLGTLIDNLKDRVCVSFEKAGFKLLGEDEGSFFAGKIEGRGVLIAYGRLHAYNGYEPQYSVLPVYVLQKMGCKALLMSCAGGAAGRDIKVGDIVAVTDHINLSGKNPLYGTQFCHYGDRFVDMSGAYSKRLTDIAVSCGKKLGIKLKKGVLAEFAGPTGETVSEVKLLRRLGCSIFGFHTVSDVIAARYAGLEVFVSILITNYASAYAEAGVAHSAVNHNRDIAEDYNSQLFGAIIEKI